MIQLKGFNIMTMETLENIKTEVTNAIGDNFYLTTDQQSFDRYPTNHINIELENALVEVGTIVYDEVKKDCEAIQYIPLILWVFEFHNLDGWFLSIGKTSKGSYNITLESEPDQHSGETDLRQGWADTADLIDKVLVSLLCQ